MLQRARLTFDNWDVVMTCYIDVPEEKADFVSSLMVKPVAPCHTFSNRRLWFERVEDGKVYASVVKAMLILR